MITELRELAPLHPTREEFEERQKLMPPGMRALIERSINDRDAKRAAAFSRAEAKAKELRDRLAAFELAVDEVIAGNEWLKMHRVTAPKEHAGFPFTHEHRDWNAVFDFTAVGGYRLWIVIDFFNGSWVPSQATFWAVTPRTNIPAKSLAEAVDFATTYCATPF